MSTNGFHRLSDNELQRLSSDELIDYIREARDAGHADAAQAALAILCYRHLDDVVRRLRLRIPTADVEDQAMTVILAAIKSKFDGTSYGEFRVWLNQIISRRGIADFHRAREDRPRDRPLPTEHQDEEEIWGEEPSEADETGRVLVQSAVDECLEDLGEAHRDVIELNVFEDLDAQTTAERVNERHPELDPPMSQANVHKIVSRFRECLTEKLEDDE